MTQISANRPAEFLAHTELTELRVAIGCQVFEGNGSRVRFEKDGIIGTFHRPHPVKEAKPYQVRDARQFLENLGVKP